MSSDDQMTALQTLADEAAGLNVKTTPKEVKRQAALCILDTVGCMIAGTRTEEAGLILGCEPGGSDASQVTIPGTNQRRGLVPGIRINGYLGDVLELNDLIGGHASIGIVSVSLALAEKINAPGSALLEAVIRGIETTARVYDAVYPKLKRFTDVGIVPVGAPSAIGAAAAASRLLELNAESTLHAMAIAGGLAGWCPAEVIFGSGGTMKPLLFGAQPAEAGLTGALYARNGMTGPTGLLDSKVGFFVTTSNGGQLELFAGKRRWALENPRRKLHACCGYIHCAADATAKLRNQYGNAALQGQVVVHVAPYVADVVGKTSPPISANDARFHLQYCVALVLCGFDVILPEHSISFDAYLSRPDVAKALERIRVVPSPSLTHYHQCEVVLEIEGKPLVKQVVSAPRGSPGEPLTEQDVVDKFFRLASPVIGDPAASRFLHEITQLERSEFVRPLLQTLTQKS